MSQASFPKTAVPKTAVPKTAVHKADVLKADVLKISSEDKDFLLLEYQTLRQEILQLKERLIKEFAIGLTGIPILLGTGYNSQYWLLLLLSPIIVLAGFLMLLFEQDSIMRAGKYIRVIIEKTLIENKEFGWEHWLEAKKERRQAEMYFQISAGIAFVLYYISGGLLAYISASRSDVNISPEFVKWFYGCIFFSSLYFVITHFKTHAT